MRHAIAYVCVDQANPALSPLRTPDGHTIAAISILSCPTRAYAYALSAFSACDAYNVCISCSTCSAFILCDACANAVGLLNFVTVKDSKGITVSSRTQVWPPRNKMLSVSPPRCPSHLHVYCAAHRPPPSLPRPLPRHCRCRCRCRLGVLRQRCDSEPVCGPAVSPRGYQRT